VKFKVKYSCVAEVANKKVGHKIIRVPTRSSRGTVYKSWKSICSDSNRFTATRTFFKRKKCSAIKTMMQVLACPTDEVSLNNASRP
jgi:hypothetical protein